MNRIANTRFARLATLVVVLLAGTSVTQAQTSPFNYQGRLTDRGGPATGAYDLQFRLFDALVSGNQVGSTLVRDDVAVSNGSFSVTLDFGAAAFPGANRFLEIGVRPGTSTGAFTTLIPLQPLTATPYAVQSLNATNAANAINATNATNAATAQNALQLGGLAASQYVSTGDSRLSDLRAPTTWSSPKLRASAIKAGSPRVTVRPPALTICSSAPSMRCQAAIKQPTSTQRTKLGGGGSLV